MTPKILLGVGASYLLAASPFMLGIAEPSIHEGRYTAIFILLNYPALVVAGAVEGIFPEMEAHTSTLLALAVCLLFWLVLALLAGLLIDWRCRRGVFGKAHDSA